MFFLGLDDESLVIDPSRVAIDKIDFWVASEISADLGKSAEAVREPMSVLKL